MHSNRSGTFTSVVAIALLLVSSSRPVDAQAAARAQEAGRAPTVDDIQRLRVFNELAVSPDGRWAAYTLTVLYGVDTSMVKGEIILLDLRQHRTQHVAVSGGLPHALRWSPSGSTLAFLAPSSGRTRIWRYSPLDPRSAPQPIAISDSLGGELLAFAWNPAGTAIAYVAREPEARQTGVEAAHTPPRLVLFRDVDGDFTGPTSPSYSTDPVGAYVAVTDLHGEPARVLGRHVVSAADGPTVDWSSADMLLVAGPPIGVSWWRQITKRELVVLDPHTGVASPVRPQRRGLENATWSPSGRRVAYVDSKFLSAATEPATLYTLRVQDPARLEVERSFDRETDGLLSALPPMWGPDDRTLYIGRYERGTARLFVIDMVSGRWRPLTPDTLSVSHYALSRDGSVLLAVLESANQPQELFRIDATTGAMTQLTHGTNDFLASVRLGHVDQVQWTSSDGRFTIHGFLVEPPAYDSTRRYPLVVQVHGGPGDVFTNSFERVNFSWAYMPSQLLASAGYLVLLPNPRGDMSYGRAFTEALRGDWGPGPFGDINAGVDALIRRGLVDSNAVGISGVSYGGYLTAYTITQTHRFAAASINDGPTDLRTDYGVNYAFHAAGAQWYFGGTPWARPDVYATQSPITYVSRVRTPVLMRYGGRSSTGDNIRQSYMLAQGFEFYAGLRDAGVPVEFVLHPDQGHGILDWRLYTDWVERSLRWFDYWLRHKGTDPIASDN